MSTNYDELHIFQASLQAFAEKVQLNIDKVVRLIALEIHKRITEKTPVKTGRARANWQVAMYAPNTASKWWDGPPEAAAAAAIEEARQTHVDASGVVWITNNLSYIIKLEHGHSQQAPNGMVALTMAEVEGWVNRVLSS